MSDPIMATTINIQHYAKLRSAEAIDALAELLALPTDPHIRLQAAIALIQIAQSHDHDCQAPG